MYHHRRCAGPLLAACVLTLGACAGDGVGLDQSGQPLTSGGSNGGVLTADFNSIQENVFTPICTVCHAGAGAPQGLRLDATNSYALLVGVPSSEVPSILRVKPGDPANSYIVQKLEGHAAVGAQMPFGGPPLPAATIAVISQWISDGALRPAAAAGRGFAATAVVPAAGDRLATAPGRLTVEFATELDQTRIDATSLRLERIGTDDVAVAVAVAIGVSPGNPRAVLVTPLVPLGTGRYRLRLGEPPDTGLADLGGRRPEGAAPLTEFAVGAEP